ncbi:MAG: transglutaminase family protein [Synechococcaceae bacterium WBA_2_066]|nr:transglutaminase family protein [Synechococcaceae bacterium WB6_1A_059]NBP32691.1 transglutaminase family protein [Synechococcaceae bacterium WB6_1B_055]NBP98308.1 transglutaminase family protein [Synechococcaceae bacterium WB6_3A_227]NBR43950.1 transglutaminase family protein [Synechococcaceae bacterium WB5_2B_268]NBY60525.1 transglutaminase family protein [Synechococcaceae bacterium LLD_019]NCU76380.1 transglutaminase family protein [Synechococcaceae bacterium WB7_1C_051]NCU90440.1 trans
MHVKISHRFVYSYSKPVQLGPHRLCLMPRSIGFQKLIQHKISFNPEPCHQFELLAAGGDQILRARFVGSTDRFEIISDAELITSPPPLLSLCLDEQEPRLPYPIGRLNADLLSNLQGWLPNGQHDPAAVALAQEAIIGSNQHCLAFLQQLLEMIQERVNYTQRHHGPPWPAGRTLRERVGSCRDLAVLMIECCRCIGLPARFVSGYHLVEPKPDRYDLHAWAEVYLPGAGWRGFDPSGIGAVDERYIPLASSSNPELTAAVSGSFSGPPGVVSEFSWQIDAAELSLKQP